MSGVVMLVQKTVASLLVDTTAYRPDDALVTNLNVVKSAILAPQQMAVAWMGTALTGEVMALHKIPRAFRNIEEIICDGEAVLPELFDQVVSETGCDRPNNVFFFIGWHNDRQRPFGCTYSCWADGSPYPENMGALGGAPEAERNRILECDFCCGPELTPEEMALFGCDTAEARADIIPEYDMLDMLQVMRQKDRNTVNGDSFVGGKAVIAQIWDTGAGQRVIHQWPEDRVGEKLNPAPMDWAEWNKRHERVAQKTVTVNQSRLKREMEERKRLKAARRGH